MLTRPWTPLVRLLRAASARARSIRPSVVARRLEPGASRLVGVGRRLAEEWLELLAPGFCRECERPHRGAAAFCGDCLPRIRWIGAACGRCGEPILRPPTVPPTPPVAASDLPRQHRLPRLDGCSRCSRYPLGFDRASAGGLYQGPLRTAVLRFKFHRDPAVLAVLEGAVLRAAASPTLAPLLARAGALVPVPMHPLKALWRGWDPVLALARRVAPRLRPEGGIPVRRLLWKVRWTPAQVGLRGVERRENLRKAFRVRPGARVPPTVILIDDVLTTGRTAAECARALKRAGARAVLVIAAAKS